MTLRLRTYTTTTTNKEKTGGTHRRRTRPRRTRHRHPTPPSHHVQPGQTPAETSRDGRPPRAAWHRPQTRRQNRTRPPSRPAYRRLRAHRGTLRDKKIAHATGEHATRLKAAVEQTWQPKVKEAARTKAAERGGITVETRVRFGFTAAPGSTDGSRVRLITQHLPASHAARLFTAREAGARALVNEPRSGKPEMGGASGLCSKASPVAASSWSALVQAASI
ncbi:telomere-protecting terminal protein Tpg [Streptomyces sp. NPDC056231]|uniref:telomere-protecting terminal protein Tpg n=1 Tax=Streptomyces sp. NPDC056231 TaxID=3345755 RepID=UPI003AB05F01